MSDTTEQECACCGFDTDCIEGLCSPCYDFNCKLEKLHKQVLKTVINKSITDHPDVQRLIGRVVELQAEVKELKGKRHITLTQAREQALFACERFRERRKWANAQETIKELQAEIKGLRIALDFYGCHSVLCNASGNTVGCICGLRQALKGNTND